MSAVDYSQTLKRMDGWIVEPDSFFLTTFLQLLALCKYCCPKTGTGQGSCEPCNLKIGTEANNWGCGEYSFRDKFFKTYLGSSVCPRAFPVFFYRARRPGRLPLSTLPVGSLSFLVCLLKKRDLSCVSFFQMFWWVLLTILSLQITASYFFNDEHFRLFVKLSIFLSSKQPSYSEVFSCTNVLRILERVADFST